MSQMKFQRKGKRAEIFYTKGLKKNVHGTSKPYELVIYLDEGFESPEYVQTYSERFNTLKQAQDKAKKELGIKKEKTDVFSQIDRFIEEL